MSDALTLNEYQARATSTAIYPGQGSNIGLLYTALGLTGESGEFSNKLKKLIRDGVTEASSAGLQDELGDALWYISQCCQELGITLEDVAEGNLDKLAKRMEAKTLRGEGDDR